MVSFGRLSADFRDFFVAFWVTCRSRVLEEGAGIELGTPGDPPGKDFGTIFGDSLVQFCPNSVRISDQSVDRPGLPRKLALPLS